MHINFICFVDFWPFCQKFVHKVWITFLLHLAFSLYTALSAPSPYLLEKVVRLYYATVVFVSQLI